MDNQKEQASALLEKKRQAFLAYEQEIDGIITGSTEEILEHGEAINRLVAKIDDINQRLHELCADNESLTAAVRSSGMQGDLPEEYQEIFEKSMAVRSVISRIQNMEDQVMDRLGQERDGLMEKIKQTNQSNEARASKYYTTTTHGLKSGRHGGNLGNA